MADKEVPKIPAPSDGDEKAKAEANAYQDETLETEAKRNAHKRHESALDNLHLAATILFWLVVILAILAIIALGWHYLMPCKYQWLSDTQVDKLQTILFTGSVAGILQIIAKNYLK